MIDPRAVRAFLDRRIAVVGVSHDRRKFGNVVFRELREHGHDVVPVNPAGGDVEGVRCYPSIEDLPDDVDGVLVMVPGDAAADAVHRAADRGITHVWLFRGVGSRGALTDDALAACAERRVEVIAGACPLMFVEPVRGAHRVHRAIRRLNRSLARAS